MLLNVLVRAHPRNGRLLTTFERLAIELGLTATLVEGAIERLADHDFVTRIPSRPPVLSIEVGDLLVRVGEAPRNLPLEPHPL